MVKITATYQELGAHAAKQLAAEIVRELRHHRQLSQAELARLCGRRQSYISRIESAQQNISLATLLEIVEAAGAELTIDLTEKS